MLSRNVGKELPLTLRNIAEERITLLLCCFVVEFYLDHLYGTYARFFIKVIFIEARRRYFRLSVQ